MSPYAIEGPASLSFSGGRTSGYMLRRILDAHGGALPDDVHVIFSDTGRERDQTYRFVREVAERWDVRIVWVYREGGFTKLIDDKSYLPNPVARFCTSDLKVKPMQAWMRARGYDYWVNIVGIRSDEPRRVSRLRSKVEKFWDYALPLADDRVIEADVLEFWRSHPFDLQLRPHESNCDLCFLKGTAKRLRIISDHPELAHWWVEQEEKIGATFRKGQSYKRLCIRANAMRAQMSLALFDPPDDLGECLCHD